MLRFTSRPQLLAGHTIRTFRYNTFSTRLVQNKELSSIQSASNEKASKSINTPSRAAPMMALKSGGAKALRHLHFTQHVAYQDGLAIMERFVEANLAFKKIQSKAFRKIREIGSGQFDPSPADPSAAAEGGEAQVSEYEKRLISSMLDDIRPAPLLLTFEFHSVYTGGRREKVTDLAEQAKKYDFKSVPYVQTSRGGQVTYHGPGQVVAYPILDLTSFTLSSCSSSDKQGSPDSDASTKAKSFLPPRCYVNGLEQSIIDTLAHGANYSGSARSALLYGIIAKRTANTGVWITETEKIASIGVHVRRGVTSHGVAINVNTDLAYPNRFVMCGVEGARTTSIAEQGVAASVRDVAYSYAGEFARLFGFDYVDHYDVDPEEFARGQQEQQMGGAGESKDGGHKSAFSRGVREYVGQKA